VESTPEATEVPLDGLRLGFAGLDLKTELFPALLAAPRDNAKPVRAHSFAGFGLDIMYPAGGYTDFSVSPVSSHPRDLFN
jgi:hypothetical protein